MISKYKLILFLFIVFISCKKETNKPVVNISPHLLDSLKYAEVQAKEDSLRSTLYYFKYTEKLPKATKLDSIVFYQRKIVMGYEVIDSIITYKNGKAFQNVLKNGKIDDFVSMARFLKPLEHYNNDNFFDIVIQYSIQGTIGQERIVFLYHPVKKLFLKLDLPEEPCCLSVYLIYNRKGDYYISRGSAGGQNFGFFKFKITNNKIKILESLSPGDDDSLGRYYKYNINEKVYNYNCTLDWDCDPQLTKLWKKFWKEYGREY